MSNTIGIIDSLISTFLSTIHKEDAIRYIDATLVDHDNVRLEAAGDLLGVGGENACFPGSLVISGWSEPNKSDHGNCINRKS